jgi:GH25 family lysozyme M1 (1,4-beta-N-acetylmuramidase)
LDFRKASGLVLILVLSLSASGQARTLGVDVSAWQGDISQTRWNTARTNNVEFTLIRSSRGGTTGTYNQNTTVGTLGHRYDDPYFVQNMTRATAAGILAGPYHFARPDLLADAGTGFPGSTGLDEANHFIEQAGSYMKPGYLRPVLDLEAGNTQRTRTALTDWAIEFANRIYDQKGVYPIIYMNSSYANDEVDSRVTVMPLWIARPSADPENPGINPTPAASYPNAFGVFNPSYPTIPDPQPWAFWQYSSTSGGQLFGYSTSTNIDRDFANGDINFVREYLMPAAWISNADGTWTTATNWNGNPNLPGANDRTIIDRPAGNYLITLASGTQSIRSLQCNERLLVQGGTLAIAQYANFTNTSTLSSGLISAGSLNNSSTFRQTGGSLISGAIAGTGTLNISGGSLTATQVLQTSLNITANAVVKITGSGTTTSRVTNLVVASTSKLDLDDNALVVDYSSTSPIASIQLALQSGFASGSWNGNGINSTFASTDAQKRYAIGFAEGSDIGSPATFLGQAAGSTSVVMRLTVYGDANLDGTTNSSDFNTLLSNYAKTAQRWSKGDFNFDGRIDTIDFNLLASNFGSGVPAPALGAVVPEPATLGSAVLLCLLGIRRERPRISTNLHE